MASDDAAKIIENLVREQLEAFSVFGQHAVSAADAVKKMSEAFQAGVVVHTVDEYHDLFTPAPSPLWDNAGDPLREGLYVVYEREADIIDPSGFLGGLAAISRHVELVDSMEAAWLYVDYLTDDEAGEPVAIKHNHVVVYAKTEAGWEQFDKAWPPVPDEYI